MYRIYSEGHAFEWSWLSLWILNGNNRHLAQWCTRAVGAIINNRNKQASLSNANCWVFCLQRESVVKAFLDGLARQILDSGVGRKPGTVVALALRNWMWCRTVCTFQNRERFVSEALELSTTDRHL